MKDQNTISNTDEKLAHERLLPIVQLGGIPVHVNDMYCITHKWKQYRHPKQKSHRRVKKWAKNRKHYRMEEQHRAFDMQGKLFVSTKIFEQLKSLPEHGG